MPRRRRNLTRIELIYLLVVLGFIIGSLIWAIFFSTPTEHWYLDMPA